MFHGRDLTPNRSRRQIRAYRKVEFSSLEHFMDAVVSEGTTVVRLDLFEEVRQTELSFIYYITPTLFVTAHDRSGYTIYEYREPSDTVVSEKRRLSDRGLVEPARRRMAEVEQRLRSAGFDVRYGRCTVPVDFPVDDSRVQ